MGLVNEIKSRNEKDDLEMQVIKIVNGYFRTNDIPLHAFKQKSSDRKEFYKGETDWMSIPVAPTGAILRTGYNVIKKIKGDKEAVKNYLGSESELAKLTDILNSSISDFFFERMKSSKIDQKILVKVAKRKTPIKGVPI